MEELRQSALRDLGLREESTPHELRMAYLQSVLGVHPDGQAPDFATFKRLTTAWDVLCRPRVALWTSAGKEEEMPSGLLSEDPEIEELLAVFARACRWAPHLPNGSEQPHLMVCVPININDVLLGTFKTTEIPRAQPCPSCHGTPSRTACPRCHGSGQVRVLEQVGFEIAPGASTGNFVRVPAMGDAGVAGSPAGDLFVVFEENLPVGVTRQGPHLQLECPVDLHTLVLGGTSWIDSPVGDRAYFKIPPGSRDGTRLSIPSLGFPPRKGMGRGDLQLRLRCRVPTDFSPAEREYFASLRGQQSLYRGPQYTALGRVGVIHLLPGHDSPLLEEELSDLALVLEESGLVPAADVREFGDFLPATVLNALVAVYRRFLGSGRMLLVGSASLAHNLSSLQVVSLFQLLEELPAADSGEGQGQAPRGAQPQHGKWQVFEIPISFLGSDSLLEDPSLSYAFEPEGPVFKAYDFRTVQMIDSFAVGKLIRVFRHADTGGGKIALIGLQDPVRRVLEDAGVLFLFDLVDLPELLPS